MKTACHPNAGTRRVALRPAPIDPKMNPVNIRATSNERLRCGEYSDVSAIVLGKAPPIASPVRKRKQSSTETEGLAAVSRLQSPRRGTQASSTGRRPNLSARGATKLAPSNKPNRPKEKKS